jgi:hypothetical protein
MELELGSMREGAERLFRVFLVFFLVFFIAANRL